MEGSSLVDSLTEDEVTVLRHYCSLLTEALMKKGAEEKKTVDQLVINAVKTGISLGVRLDIKDGEVIGRT
jgi:hypothetical protein